MSNMYSISYIWWVAGVLFGTAEHFSTEFLSVLSQQAFVSSPVYTQNSLPLTHSCMHTNEVSIIVEKEDSP
jgi:hypothetical protein